MAQRIADLPIHLRTGLRAVGIVNGRPVWPILGGEESADAAAQAAARAAADAAAETARKAAEGDRGFPEGTPVAEMTHAQQAAYYKHQARKHEDRNKAVGLTAEEAQALRDKAKKADEYEAQNATEVERRENAARSEAEQSAADKYLPKLAETAFRVAVGDRKTDEEVREFIADLNLSRFLTDDGDVDTAKVLSRVEQFAPAKGNQQQPPGPKGPVVRGHGSGGGRNEGAGDGSVATGRDLYRSKHPTKQ